MQGGRTFPTTKGLAGLVGPLLVIVAAAVNAQDYIDVEAERRAAVNPVNTAAQPAVTKPATSQSLGTLLYQMQQLQQEVMMLNGRVEELSYEVRRLKDQSLERYIDLDRRLSAANQGQVGNSNAGNSTTGTHTGANAGTTTAGAVGTGRQSNAELPGESQQYRAAYAQVRDQRFQEAVEAFSRFLRDFPDGRFAPNAHYWLGELYLVTEPQDLEASRQAFTLLLDQYPNNPKVPDALFKLGKVHFLKGNPARGKTYLDRLIRDFGSSNSSAVQLAKDFIDENY